MLSRHLRRVRAWWAAGLFLGALASPILADDAPAAVPGPESVPETVEILKARDAGEINITVRGQGEDRVKFQIRNATKRRLNVIIPPGLVASSTLGQGAGAGAGGGGFQSMGLGTPTANAGSFGRFQANSNVADAAFRSLPPSPEGIAISADKTVEFTIPSVCLNFGIATPTPKDQFRLMDVNDYSRDPRVRKALRSLSTLGTSHGVAQAVMWHVSNGMSFDQLAAQGTKFFNIQELTLAARFVAALDGSGSSELVEPTHLVQARLLVNVFGEGSLAKDASRLRSELQGQRLLGLPVQVVDKNEDLDATPSTLHLNIILASGEKNTTRVKVAVRYAPYTGGWALLGNASGQVAALGKDIDADSLLKAVDKTVASRFVTTKIVHRGQGTTVLEVKNGLPLTLANVTLRAGRDDDASRVPVQGIGVGPGRAARTPVSAATGFVDRVELNGL
jgi:hypothetical protein